ncbi:hypothetical protein [Sulfitobacter sp. D7]|jgi:hypothetical protein|uniref:hypothetical protein n=1 Tax=Sulfitobacter sp. D7 TaxID=1968541 RepID=UPI000E77B9A5|nr:hypothetical protein [Sulfitobacter sp. D7]AYE86119.1 hypothetical protein B5M07_08330 [Sulfitobacter sp. D7]
MERELSFAISNASQRNLENRVPFKMEIYEFEGGDGWSLEVVTEDGTSIVWKNSWKMTESHIKRQLAPFAVKPAMIGTRADLQIISKSFFSGMLNQEQIEGTTFAVRKRSLV